MDLEREHDRRTYQLCRLAFGFLSLALVVACATTFLSLLELTRPFGGHGLGPGVRDSLLWRWVDIAVIWPSLLGAYLLWGRWHDLSWQRRTGLLVLMSVADVVLWLLEHGDALGLGLDDVGHEWFRSQLGQALGWAEFALMASLSGDFLYHLGIESAPEAARTTRSLAATGSAVWMLVFITRTDWGHGWPLEMRPFRSLEVYFLFVGAQMLWTITLVQTTALTIAAMRQGSRTLAELDREESDDALLRSPSEAGHDLLPAHRDESPWDDRDGP